jgi:methylmalonyl-CoA mutase
MADFPKRTLADWEALARAELKDKPVDSLGLGDSRRHRRQAALHRDRSRGARARRRDAGLPAVPARAARRTMFANRPWTIRQYAGFSTAEASNAFSRRR